MLFCRNFVNDLNRAVLVLISCVKIAVGAIFFAFCYYGFDIEVRHFNGLFYLTGYNEGLSMELRSLTLNITTVWVIFTI